MVLGLNQPVTVRGAENIPGGKEWPVHQPGTLTACVVNVGASTSHSPMGLHGLFRTDLLLQHKSTDPILHNAFNAFVSNFRMYPVVIGNGRLLTRDTVIAGYRIPKGVRLHCNRETLWPLVRKRTIPTERPTLVGES
jgi:hypothetical protein